MMEPIEWKETEPRPPVEKPWAADGRDGDGMTHFVTSLRLQSEKNERFVQSLFEKYAAIERDEVRYEAVGCENADLLIAAFGTTARIALSAARRLEKEGVRAGLFRPITLWPFPSRALRELAGQKSVKAVMTVEMSMGQMVQDVRLALEGMKPVTFYGRTGGMVPEPAHIAEAAKKTLSEVK